MWLGTFSKPVRSAASPYSSFVAWYHREAQSSRLVFGTNQPGVCLVKTGGNSPLCHISGPRDLQETNLTWQHRCAGRKPCQSWFIDWISAVKWEAVDIVFSFYRQIDSRTISCVTWAADLAWQGITSTNRPALPSSTSKLKKHLRNRVELIRLQATSAEVRLSSYKYPD